jgi:hypothetical protein
MSLRTKQMCLSLTLIVALAVLFAYLPLLRSAENSEADEVLLFLEDVIGIDVAKYNVTLLGTSVTYPDWRDGLEQVAGKICLESKTSRLDVLFKFRNSMLSWCLVRTVEGTPHYLDVHSGNICDLASGFLEKYQIYVGDSELEAMRNILNGIEGTDNATKTVGNLKLTVSITSFSSYFEWRYTVDGIDCCGVDVSFSNGHFYAFGDDRYYYPINIT